MERVDLLHLKAMVLGAGCSFIPVASVEGRHAWRVHVLPLQQLSSLTCAHTQIERVILLLI